MIRAAWNIANSESNFDVFSTLTFREAHPEPKRCLREFIKRVLGLRSEHHSYAWVQEYQKRGIVHYHLLWKYEESWLGVRGIHPGWTPINRRGTTTEVLTDYADEYLSDEWITCVGDTSTEFWRFQHGRCHERVANPELAGKYLGSYAGKEGQKRLPDNEAPQGRWWYMSPAARPVPRGTFLVTDWLAKKPHHLVHDAAKTMRKISADCLQRVEPTVEPEQED